MTVSRVRVKAPSSIANLGVLFDLAALAVSYAYDTVTVEVVGRQSSEPRVEVEAVGAPSGESNTAYVAARKLLEYLDEKLHVRILLRRAYRPAWVSGVVVLQRQPRCTLSTRSLVVLSSR
ncbi:hypothetical protein [Hyperthermus butylicus]|uniref:Homoserine kinase n=1 Tax=Hyperthermus butylicus (strain DSM 5456 / JCM 9403 / PLM1-5) TaxID=415426 RepID=A2BL09_HYPBU|nr:hypothetical protein [Hyperthermus butylicus]ABM80670.1 hypothetical protein Hbut_0817 [Hyperthermus butylicus DSM 5456]